MILVIGSLDPPPRLALRVGGHRPREPGAPPSTPGPPAIGGPTPSVSVGSDLLGWLSRVWAGWRSSLLIVQPATVLAWHRQGFQLYWRWKSRPNPVGRPRLDAELRDLIRRMARENPTWGRRRIRAELALLGYEVAELTVAKYMHRTSPRPSPTWRTFLTAHARDIVAIDFFVVPTITFHLLFVFIVLRHHRRELLHLNVTEHPTAAWTARQIVEAFPDETAPKYLLRDRDRSTARSSHGASAGWGFVRCSSPHSAPWQNPFAERVIGSIRRVPRSLHRSERGASPPRLAGVSGLLQRLAATSSAGPQQPPPTGHRTPPLAGSWRFRRSADSISGTSASPDPRRPEPTLLARGNCPADLAGPRLGLLGDVVPVVVPQVLLRLSAPVSRSRRPPSWRC